MDKKRERTVKIIIIILIIAMLLFLAMKFIFPDLNIVGKAIFFSPKKVQGVSQTIMVELNKDTLPLVLESQNIVKDIPSKGIVSLKLYNFNSGQRAIEESYVIAKGSVKKGEATNPDIKILIHSKYVSEAGDICSAIKKARTNGDLSYEFGISKTSLLFKYGKMMGYKKCLG